jgi:hypothetical protein
MNANTTLPFSRKHKPGTCAQRKCLRRRLFVVGSISSRKKKKPPWSITAKDAKSHEQFNNPRRGPGQVRNLAATLPVHITFSLTEQCCHSLQRREITRPPPGAHTRASRKRRLANNYPELATQQLPAASLASCCTCIENIQVLLQYIPTCLPAR